MLMYYVIGAGSNPYDMTEWDSMPMTEQDAEQMREAGYICIRM